MKHKIILDCDPGHDDDGHRPGTLCIVQQCIGFADDGLAQGLPAQERNLLLIECGGIGQAARGATRISR